MTEIEPTVLYIPEKEGVYKGLQVNSTGEFVKSIDVETSKLEIITNSELCLATIFRGFWAHWADAICMKEVHHHLILEAIKYAKKANEKFVTFYNFEKKTLRVDYTLELVQKNYHPEGNGWNNAFENEREQDNLFE